MESGLAQRSTQCDVQGVLARERQVDQGGCGNRLRLHDHEAQAGHLLGEGHRDDEPRQRECIQGRDHPEEVGGPRGWFDPRLITGPLILDSFQN